MSDILLQYPLDKAKNIDIENHLNYGVVGKTYVKEEDKISFLAVKNVAYDVQYGIGCDEKLFVTIIRYTDHTKEEVKETSSYEYIFKDTKDIYDFLNTVLEYDIAEAVRTHTFTVKKSEHNILMFLVKYK